MKKIIQITSGSNDSDAKQLRIGQLKWQQFTHWYYTYFSVGTGVLLLGLIILFSQLVKNPTPNNHWGSLILPLYLVAQVIDLFCRNHLLANLQIHQQLHNSEADLLTSLTSAEVTALVDWYAQWLAVFTGSVGRWFDLCAYQLIGSFADLMEFQRMHSDIKIDDCLIRSFTDQWSFADEQVFKIYYGSRIKRRAWRYLKWTHAKSAMSLEHEYVDQLLDTYGKSYYEYALFLVDRLRQGYQLRELYLGWSQQQHGYQARTTVSQWAVSKSMLQASAYSLKDMLFQRNHDRDE